MICIGRFTTERENVRTDLIVVRIFQDDFPKPIAQGYFKNDESADNFCTILSLANEIHIGGGILAIIHR